MPTNPLALSTPIAMQRRKETVVASEEFYRVAGLPRRVWNDEGLAGLVAYYTDTLRTLDGTMQLRPVQALALHELAQCGGLFGAIRVGGGKTLLSMLAARMTGSVRPLLLLPAALIEKTKVETAALSRHWRIPRNVIPFSYEMLSRDQCASYLDNYRPDLIIADEAHRLKNRKAAVTRRIERYLRSEHGQACRVVVMSGTLVKDDLSDFAHLLRWALRDGAPVPRPQDEVDTWASAIGWGGNPFSRALPGPILGFAQPEDVDQIDDLVTARQAFRRRLLETPGVVASRDDGIACSIVIREIETPVTAQSEANFSRLRGDWMTPDEWPLWQAIDVWRHARELALGFHYVWDPRPPSEWLVARKAWAQTVRKILQHSRTIDTELQVRNAVAEGQFDHWADPITGLRAVDALAAWQLQAPTFEPRARPIWHDGTALGICLDWIKKHRGIVWSDHAFFGRELARLSGATYYGEQGVSDAGQSIEDADPRHGLIASGRANSTGRNLQAWSANLITAPPSGAPEWEQRLGRTHRDGQRADTVTVDVLIGCAEHLKSIRDALSAGAGTRQMTGHEQKILLADMTIDLDRYRRGAQWIANDEFVKAEFG